MPDRVKAAGLKLDRPGEHALTAIDGEGRCERMAFTLKGP